MKDPEQREPALITCMVTASGLTLCGVGAAFRGVVAGLLALLLAPRGVAVKQAWAAAADAALLWGVGPEACHNATRGLVPQWRFAALWAGHANRRPSP